MSATGTPARSAMATPSPVDWGGLVVTENSWPAPPVARRVWAARSSTTLPVGVQGGDAPAPSVFDDQVEGEPSFPDSGGGGPGRVHEGPFHLGAGGRPAGVDDPGGRVAALAGQLPDALVVAVELGSEGGQLTHPSGSLADEHLHRGRVAQAGPGPQGVGRVQGDGIHGCGSSASRACDTSASV